MRKQHGTGLGQTFALSWARFNALSNDEKADNLAELKRERERVGVKNMREYKNRKEIARVVRRDTADRFVRAVRAGQVPDSHGEYQAPSSGTTAIVPYLDPAARRPVCALRDLPAYRRAMASDMRAQRHRSDQEVREMQAAVDSPSGGQLVLDGASKVIPTVRESRGDFIPTPPVAMGPRSITHRLVQWSSLKTAKVASTLSALSLAKKLGRVVSRFGAQMWAHVNCLVGYRRIAAVDAAIPVHRYCNEYHVCVCEGDGPLLVTFKFRLDNNVKLHFPRKSPDFEALLRRYIGCIIISTSADAFLVDSEDRDPADFSFLFLHIGWHVQKPWMTHFQEMELSEKGFDEVIPEDWTLTFSQPFKLRGTGNAFDTIKLAETLDLSFVISVAYFKLVDNYEMLPQIQPDCQVARLMFGGRVFNFWSDNCVRRAATGPMARLAASMAADPGDASEDDDEEDAARSSSEDSSSTSSSSSSNSSDDGSDDDDADFGVSRKAGKPLYAWFPPEGLGIDGCIKVYESGDIYALCCADDHDKCYRSRSQRLNATRPAQGRPLGYMFAYLLCQDEFLNKSDHKEATKKISFDDRRLARDLLATLPFSDELFRFEQPLDCPLPGDEPRDHP